MSRPTYLPCSTCCDVCVYFNSLPTITVVFSGITFCICPSTSGTYFLQTGTINTSFVLSPGLGGMTYTQANFFTVQEVVDVAGVCTNFGAPTHYDLNISAACTDGRIELDVVSSGPGDVAIFRGNSFSFANPFLNVYSVTDCDPRNSGGIAAYGGTASMSP